MSVRLIHSSKYGMQEVALCVRREEAWLGILVRRVQHSLVNFISISTKLQSNKGTSYDSACQLKATVWLQGQAEQDDVLMKQTSF